MTGVAAPFREVVLGIPSRNALAGVQPFMPRSRWGCLVLQPMTWGSSTACIFSIVSTQVLRPSTRKCSSGRVRCSGSAMPLDRGLRALERGWSMPSSQRIRGPKCNRRRRHECTGGACVFWIYGPATQSKIGRSERIRTSGPCVPNTVLYQAELHSGRGAYSRARRSRQSTPGGRRERASGGADQSRTEAAPRAVASTLRRASVAGTPSITS